MASLLLGVAGSALGGALLGDGISVLGATITGAQIGGTLGALAGGQIDAALTPGRHVSREGARLSDLSLQASQEGAPVPRVFGRVRLAGQLIWASRFRETATSTKTAQGGKGGPSVSVSETDYTYSISFAVGLCEGVCARIGRVWANGTLLDLTRFTWRFHSGSETQSADPVIADTEGDGGTPAYRGLCYLVFEDLPLAEFGNRIPQLQFEVFRPLVGEDDLENRLTAVALIPGAGEFVYATDAVMADDGNGGSASQNVHAGRADIIASLDDLQAMAPNLDTVALVVGWFGDHLAAGTCAIRPGVEAVIKTTYPEDWGVAGLTRADAHLVSTIDGRPAYGGTPSDASVVAVIAELKRRGLRVVFAPFLFLDCAGYPWRGRIAPAATDQTSGVTDDVAAFFGGTWGWRRMVLHYAQLCADAGGVDDFLIGSELVGLTRARSDAATYPAVTALRTLAADVRAVIGSDTRISYGADWSEYNNHQTGGGSVRFNLDPLWADANIDFIGIDNYLPLADWRDGNGHIESALAASTYDRDYLQANIRGEDYDWYYASDADRLSQTRTPITDGLGKPWVWRAKDLWNWWSNAHHDRPDGSESAGATAFVPMAKSIVFTELGCPAIDKGANQPNVFFDPKSSESALPHFSSGARDDLMQRRFLEAHAAFWADVANNPMSPLYYAPMIERSQVWCWDARPYPWFPALGDVWGDAPNWQFGHWLNGRLGAVPLAGLVAALCADAGFSSVDVTGLDGLVTGYAVTDTISPRDALAPLAVAFGFDAVESQGVLRFVMRGRAAAASLTQDALVLPESDHAPYSFSRAQESDLPQASRITYIDGAQDYAAGSVEARRLTGASLRVATSSLAVVMDQGQATAIGERLLQDAWAMRESAAFALAPSQLALEAADEVLLTAGGREHRLRITAIADAGARGIEAVATDPSLYMQSGPASLPVLRQSLTPPGRALLFFLDLPWLVEGQNTSAPFVGAFADPWPGPIAVMRSTSGEDYALDATLTKACSFGVTTEDFWSGPAGHWDRGNRLNVKLVNGALTSATEQAVFGGANVLAVQNADGGWEVLQFVTATLTAPGEYVLTQLRRGRRGSEVQMRVPVAAGARVIVLDDALVQLSLTRAQARQPFHYRWGPASRPVTDISWQEAVQRFEAAALIPLAPCHVRHAWDGSDLILSWLRRDRDPASAHLTQAVTPMSEAVEAYDLEICDASGAVVRSFAGVTQHRQRYTAAQQAADFPTGLPNPLTVNVYQLSSATGRGRQKKETLYVR